MASERQNSLGVELRDRIVSVQLAHVTVVSRPDDWHHGICHCGAPIYSAMTDNLRDRIAAAILRDRIGRTELHTYQAHLLAYAVIAELSLRHVIDYCERQAVVGWLDDGRYRCCVCCRNKP